MKYRHLHSMFDMTFEDYPVMGEGPEQMFGNLFVVFPTCDFCWREPPPDNLGQCYVFATHVHHSDSGPVYSCDDCV